MTALESRVADARSQKDGLRQKEPLMDSLRERIHDVMGTGDASAQEVGGGGWVGFFNVLACDDGNLKRASFEDNYQHLFICFRFRRSRFRSMHS